MRTENWRLLHPTLCAWLQTAPSLESCVEGDKRVGGEGGVQRRS